MAFVIIDIKQSVMATIGQVWNASSVNMDDLPVKIYDTSTILGISSPSNQLVVLRQVGNGISQWMAQTDQIAKAFVTLVQTKLGIGA